MTVEMFSPRWYYRGTISEENQERIKKSFSKFIEEDKNFANKEEWNCNVLTSYQVPTNESADWDTFLECVRPCVTEFMEEMKPKMNLTIKPQEGWVNKYRKGHYQETHCHSVPFCNLAMVYFYQMEDKECPYFKFYNNWYPQYKASGLDDAFTIPTSWTVSPRANQGDLIIFPAHYPHMVSPNREDCERVTISANMYVMPDEEVSTNPPMTS